MLIIVMEIHFWISFNPVAMIVQIENFDEKNILDCFENLVKKISVISSDSKFRHGRSGR